MTSSLPKYAVGDWVRWRDGGIAAVSVVLCAYEGSPNIEASYMVSTTDAAPIRIRESSILESRSATPNTENNT